MHVLTSKKNCSQWNDFIHECQFSIPNLDTPESDGEYVATWRETVPEVVKAVGVWEIAVSLTKVYYIIPGDVYEFHSAPSISYSALRRLAENQNINPSRSTTDLLRESFVGDIVDTLRKRFEVALLEAQWRKQLISSQSQPWWVPPWNGWSFSIENGK